MTSNAIEEAQALALKRDRQQACARLREALKTIPPSAKHTRARIYESLAQIDKVFFSDKGQKEFEAGQSLMFEGPDLALTKLQAALGLEDNNVLVLSTIAKVQLLKMDCDGAESSVTKARAMNPFAVEPALLNLRVLACKKKYADFTSAAEALPTLSPWEENYRSYLSAIVLMEQKNSRRAFDTFLRVAESQPSFPESFYHLAKVGAELNKDNSDWLRKYVSLCKVISPKDRKRFSLEPRLCISLKDAINELSKKSTDI